MDFKLTDALSILSRTPAILTTLLSELPSDWIFNNEGNDTWSPYDVLGHLIHGERTDWLPRAKMILRAGESEAFAPFNRFAQFEESQGKSLEELLSTFAALRAESLQELSALNLTTEDLMKRGTHPTFGSVKLEQLLATWVAHDLSHVTQITRTMAKQYGDAVGPWKEFLSVLK